MLRKFSLLIILTIFTASILFAQRHGYWQQEVDYKMEIDFDVTTNQFDGHQLLTYFNHSPDTLNRVFYHLYFNAFQPESMMDKRSRTIEDPDSRVLDRILYYDETEIGYQKIETLTQNGTPVEFTIKGTVMEVHLAEPILPGSETVFEMNFTAQVPLQTRRSGRDNPEGIRYSMAQWYPKIAAYDHMGWHPTPYIAREFHGVFGNFDVTIHIDRNYVVAATGYLQNPEQTGYGYETADMQVQRPAGDKLSWHFKSDYQHDFMWAADPDYTHVTAKVPDGPLLRFFYQTDPVAENADDQEQARLLSNWEQLPEFTIKAFQYMNENFGKYPYDEYIIIQGGDGGMEYIMGTLITGNRTLGSLVGVTVHELVHAWYQGVLANNESYYHWIDEGFTTYASNLVMAELFPERRGDPFANNYRSYRVYATSGLEEPMHTHADHFTRNQAYGIAAYTKGAIFLHQLSYIIGQETFERGMKRFYEEWKFKHPGGHDFIRVMENESGIKLDWYYDYWITSTKTINYAIGQVTGSNNKTEVTLEKIGLMPMPLDIEVEYTDGSRELFYIPLRIMWGEKENEYDIRRTILDDWPWVFPTYKFEIPRPHDEIQRIEIDPTNRMADVNPQNKIYMCDMN
ncbi:MAG: M1 family metallopeptidase [Balneolaceae bacterium]